jgi:predicted Zn-dependent peptidase
MTKQITKTYGDGTKVLLLPMKQVGIVRVEMRIACGWIHEIEGKCELLHFMEHLLAGFSSSKYPDSKLNMRKVEEMGVQTNAFTSIEEMGFHLEGPKESLPFLLDLLLQSYLHFEVDMGVFQQEKDSVVNELNMRYDQNHWEKSSESLVSQLYSELPAIKKRTTKVRLKDLKHITKEDVHKVWCKIRYMGLVSFIVCGDVIIKEVDSLFGKALAVAVKPARSIRGIIEPKLKINKYTPKTTSHVLYTKVPDSSTTLVEVMWIHNVDTFHKDQYVFALAQEILVGGLSSRLLDRLRSQLGIVYFVDVSRDNLPSRNAFVVSTEVTKVENVTIVVKVVLEEVKRLQEELVPDIEFTKVINKVRTYMALDVLCKTPKKCVDEVVPFFVWGKPFTSTNDMLKAITKLTPRTLRNTMKKRLVYDDMLVVLAGNTDMSASVTQAIHKAFVR